MNKIITMNDIAGYEEEKKVVEKIIKMINDYKYYKKEGSELPKGILFYGVPGSGKTLFSKAIINETNVKTYVFKTGLFFNGLKLQKIFEKARKHVPSIIFIDELESIVSCGLFQSDDSRSALSVLLTELDGYKNNDGVLFIATTTARDDLPEALIRPGRIDVQINIPYPNRYNRKKILEYYINKSTLKNNIDIDSLSLKTVGFNGADLNTLVRQTILNNTLEDKTDIVIEDFYDVLNNIRFKDIKRTEISTNRNVVSIHELGHFVSARELLNLKADISIESFGDSLGSTCYEEATTDFSRKDNQEYDDDDEEDSSEKKVLFQSLSSSLNYVKVLLAGRAAEEVFFNELYSGSGEDVLNASDLCARILSTGMMGLEYVDNEFFTCETKTLINNVYHEKISMILNEQYKEVKDLIVKNKSTIEYLNSYLIDKGFLSSKEIEELLNKKK